MPSNLQTTFTDYPDNSSIAVIYYVRGCIHKCDYCHNLELQFYQETPLSVIDEIVEYCRRSHTNKIVLSGGDPLYPKNLSFTNELVNRLHTNYDICIYTGYDVEYAKKVLDKGFKFLKCNKFDNNLIQKSCKTDEYMQLASKNQEIYNGEYKLITVEGKLLFKGAMYV